MGAMPYQNLAKWDSDPQVALRALQAEFLDANYELPKVLEQHLQSSKQAVECCIADGDEYGVQDIHQSEVDYIESILSKPLPESAEEKIEILRKVWESGGQGIGNILDITEVSERGGILVAKLLSHAEIEKYFGTSLPSISEAGKIYAKNVIDRGECVCFPIYDLNTPIGWMFVGYTID